MRAIRIKTPAQALPALLVSQVTAQLGQLAAGTLELRFDPVRRWRFDVAWPGQNLAVEIEGGAWTTGRHTRGPGFERDIEKYNEALCAGWRVLRVTPDQVRDGTACDWVLRLLCPSKS